MRMRSRRWTGSSVTVVERRSSTVWGSLRTAMLADVRRGESSIGRETRGWDARFLRPLRLRADEPVQDLDARLTRHGDVSRASGPGLDTHQCARPDEQVPDVARQIRE